MPPTINSTDRYCSAIVDDDGDLILTDPEPYGYRALADNATMVVSEGDSLTRLAYRRLGRALWWRVVADFNGVYDPTIRLEVGAEIQVPSRRAVSEEILSESRRAEYQA